MQIFPSTFNRNKIPTHLWGVFLKERQVAVTKTAEFIILRVALPIHCFCLLADYYFAPNLIVKAAVLRFCAIPAGLLGLKLYNLDYFKKNFFLPYGLMCLFGSVTIVILLFLVPSDLSRHLYFSGTNLAATVLLAFFPLPRLWVCLLLSVLYVPYFIWVLNITIPVDYLLFQVAVTFGTIYCLILFRRTLINSYHQEFLLRSQLNVNARVGQDLIQISHDIRSPLTALRYIQNQNESLDTLKEMLRVSIGRLVELADGIIHYGSQLQISKQKVDLIKFSRELQDYIQFLHTNSTLSWETNFTEPWAVFDPSKVSRVIINLVNNSMKVTKGIDHPYVHVVIARDAESFNITVTDNGPGFGQINPFSEQIKSETGGTGIGLKFCRQVVEEHGGNISFKRQDNTTVVHFQFPIN